MANENRKAIAPKIQERCSSCKKPATAFKDKKAYCLECFKLKKKTLHWEELDQRNASAKCLIFVLTF